MVENSFAGAGAASSWNEAPQLPRRNTPSDMTARNTGALLITPGWLRRVLLATWITGAPASRAHLKTRWTFARTWRSLTCSALPRRAITPSG